MSVARGDTTVIALQRADGLCDLLQEAVLGRRSSAITLRLGLGSCDATSIPSA